MAVAVLWPMSATQINDVNGKPHIGAEAHFTEGDTNDDLVSGPWADKDMTVEHPNPVETNGFGMWPVVFFSSDTEFYGLRITDADDNQLLAKTVIPVGGPPADTGTPIVGGDLATGDLQASYLTGNRNGYVRANGMTIGDGSSGATERANADCQALFELLWNANKAHFAVSGSRGASATADWNNHKRITLPDLRGRTPVGRNTMGASAASGALTTDAIDDSGNDFNGTPNEDADIDVIGSHGGNDFRFIDLSEIPAHQHVFTGGGGAYKAEATAEVTGGILTSGAHRHDIYLDDTEGVSDGGTGGDQPDKSKPLKLYRTEADGAHAHTHDIAVEVTLDLVMSEEGEGLKHKNMQPYGIVTFYIKL